jgi:hypothetical protein
MDDFNQIEVPPSFLALFASPSGYKLTQPMSAVRERYELCEDLAQMLSEQAVGALASVAGDQREVLEKMKLGLSVAGSPVQPGETTWVVTRVAELLGWELPAAEA